MAETAAHLADHVIPRVPVRQWIITLPVQLRYRVAFDPKLTSDVLSIFLGVVRNWYQRQAKRRGLVDPQFGSVTVIQRSGSALNLNPHAHSLVLDGVYSFDSGRWCFHPAAPPTDTDIEELLATTAERIIGMLDRRGIMSDEELCDPLVEEHPAFAPLVADSVSGMGHSRLLVPMSDTQHASPLCAAYRGFSLHAATRVAAHRRSGLEQLCRYVARPPLAIDRLTQIGAGKLAYKLKKPWADGTTHLFFTPRQLLAKLAALVPPPRFNSVRYHGVLAPNSKARKHVVPSPLNVLSPETATGGENPTRRRKRYSWSQLLARVFRIDVTLCPQCGGNRKIIAVIMEASVIQGILSSMNLSADPPTPAGPRAPPQVELDFA